MRAVDKPAYQGSNRGDSEMEGNSTMAGALKARRTPASGLLRRAGQIRRPSSRAGVQVVVAEIALKNAASKHLYSTSLAISQHEIALTPIKSISYAVFCSNKT